MKNPLFYKKIVPLDNVKHRDLRLTRKGNVFPFARGANLIPAVIDEFGAAMAHLPIAFLPGAKQPAAVFLIGLEPGSNLFLESDDSWVGRYVPAYLRRYPFIVGDVPGGEALLCLDEGDEGISTSEGERLFNDAGEAEPAVIQARDLCANYKRSADRTDEFCATLQKLGLFESVTLNAQTPDRGNTVVHGLFTVDEAAFDRLAPEDVTMLHEKRFLKPIVQHMASMGAVTKLADRNAERLKASAA
ncbi:SapC family protein [Aquibium carbonis]|uniref:SapC family protein n=1 Tax=Aquibium carbonis TaxID=2495581 RepID=A0A429YV67_9HYPH|nr:SapC family protein [Aquibium carbonis]RST85341.1 SapC family protein [Aquibium carbonis]